jgi:DNA-binding Lrp family transcriptional regulator
MALDQLDLQILEHLRDDARLPIKGLAARISLSRAAVHARVKRMTDNGTIRGSTLRDDHAAVGLPVTALISVDVRHPGGGELVAALEAIPLVQWAGFVSGDQDLLLLVRAGSVQQLRDEVVWFLRQQPAVRATKTQLVMEEVMDRPFLIPPTEAPPGP